MEKSLSYMVENILPTSCPVSVLLSALLSHPTHCHLNILSRINLPIKKGAITRGIHDGIKIMELVSNVD